MCLGALVWAGVDRLVFGARREDVERIAGFDEGPVHPAWMEQLTERGIQVVPDVLRQEACEVLRRYTEKGGTRY